MTIPTACQVCRPSTTGGYSGSPPFTWLDTSVQHSTIDQAFNAATSTSRVFPREIGYFEARAWLSGTHTGPPYICMLKYTTVAPAATIELCKQYGSWAYLSVDLYVADPAAYFWLDFGGTVTSCTGGITIRRVG